MFYPTGILQSVSRVPTLGYAYGLSTIDYDLDTGLRCYLGARGKVADVFLARNARVGCDFAVRVAACTEKVGVQILFSVIARTGAGWHGGMGGGKFVLADFPFRNARAEFRHGSTCGANAARLLRVEALRGVQMFLPRLVVK